ncbi:riboflavin synthase [Candidatus Kapabacteria bacterium]|nr:riboflavin synthase [Candidatus Kapabacteria bacterium]
MFTGLVEEIGKIKNIKAIGAARRFNITAKKVLTDAKIDDSICVNGCCLTVVESDSNSFSADVIEESIRKTNLGTLKIGDVINLERSLLPTQRLGGHIMQGHVDTVGKVVSIKPESSGKLVTISFDGKYRKYIVPVGSIAINGISLTVAKVESNTFTVAIIPHTWENTSLKIIHPGDSINLEFDVLGKYVENMVKFK